MTKYIVDLAQHGKIYYDMIRSLDLGNYPGITPQQLAMNHKFIYNDSAGQIATILSPDAKVFFGQLTNFPNLSMFAHIENFSDGPRRQMFIDAFKAFAYGIWDQIRMRPGLQMGFDYTIEGIAEDHVIVGVYPTTPVFQSYL